MARLPIDLRQQAFQATPGQRVQADTAFGAGLRDLGQGVSQAGIAMQRKETARKNLDFKKRRSALMEELPVAVGESLRGFDISQDSQGVKLRSDFTSKYNDLAAKSAAGLSEDLQKEYMDYLIPLKDTQMQKLGNGVVAAGDTYLRQSVEDAYRHAVQEIEDSPDSANLDFAIGGIDYEFENIAELINLSPKQMGRVKQEKINDLKLDYLNMKSNHSITQAEVALQELESEKFKTIPVEKREAAKADILRNGMQRASKIAAGVKTQVDSAVKLSYSGVSTDVTPDMIDAQMSVIPETFMPNKAVESQRLKAAAISAYVTANQINAYKGAPYESIRRAVLDSEAEVANISQYDPELATEQAQSAKAKVAALNKLKSDYEQNPNLAAHRAYPVLEEMKRTVEDKDLLFAQAVEQSGAIGGLIPGVAGAVAEISGIGLAMADLSQSGSEYIAALDQVSTEMYGRPGVVPLYEQAEGKRLLNKIESAQSAEQSFELIDKQVETYGNTARVLDSLFPDSESSPWMFLYGIGAKDAITNTYDPVARRNALDLTHSWKRREEIRDVFNDNKNAQEAMVDAGVQKNSASMLIKEKLSSLRDSFQGGEFDAMFQSAAEIAEVAYMEQMIKTGSHEDSLTYAVDKVNSNFVFIEPYKPNSITGLMADPSGFSNVRLSRSVVSQYPGVQVAVEAMTKNELGIQDSIKEAYASRISPEEFGFSDEVFMNQPLSFATSPDGFGVYTYIGNNSSDVLTNRKGEPIVVPWSVLNRSAYIDFDPEAPENQIKIGIQGVSNKRRIEERMERDIRKSVSTTVSKFILKQIGENTDAE